MFIIVAIFIKFFGHVQQVNVCRCHFSVMFKDFGHFDSAILTTLVSVLILSCVATIK